MSSIIFYAHKTNETQSDRIDGMIWAGDQVKRSAPNVANANQATTALTAIVNAAVNGPNSHADLDTNGGVFGITTSSGNNYTLSGTTNKLMLKGDVDDQASGLFRMVGVLPANANMANSWSYITGTVIPDVQAIVTEVVQGTKSKDDLEDYLIATFTFSRCR